MKKSDYINKEIKKIENRIDINSHNQVVILSISLALALILLIGYISNIRFVQILLFFLTGLITWLLYISIDYKKNENKLAKIRDEIKRLKSN